MIAGTASAAWWRPWRLLPAHVANGIATAVGIGCIQLAAWRLFGGHVAALVVSGAVCASIADLPNVPSRTLHRVGAAALLSAAAALAVDLLRPHPLGLGIVVVVVAFLAMMTLAWGQRAGAVSFSPILSMIFSMAVPPAEHELAIAGWGACGGFAYLLWALLANLLLQRRYRTLALVATLRAASQLFRSRAGVLVSYRIEAGEAPPLGSWIGGDAALAERLQAARDLLYPAAESRRWQRDVAILLRIIDLRDALITSRLDVDLLGADAAGREILERAASGLRSVADQLDRAADALRDDSEPATSAQPSLDIGAAADELAMPPGDPRARLLPVLQGRLDRLTEDVGRLHRLLRGEIEALPLSHAQLQGFVAPEGWPIRALRPHWQRDSLVLRHAVRMSLALGTAYYLALALPWDAHPYWLVLSVGVVLRGNLSDTLARRDARVLGTMLGCLIVVGVSHVPSAGFLSGVFLGALATAHAFVTQRYWLTATAASVMALLQSHLVNPEAGFAIAERVGDTFLGAMLAWSFSYVLPSWERRRVPEAVARVLRELRDYAAHSLRAGSGDVVDERMARRKAYESLSLLGAALSRSRVEPRGVRLPIRKVATLLDHGERFMAHLSLVRHSLARLHDAAELPRIESALAQAVAAVGRCLDLQEVGPASEIGSSGGDERTEASGHVENAERSGDVESELADPLELLPAQPPARDVVPWLSRRLSQLVDEAVQIRSAARSSLPG
ncbi:MAG: FUSC family protein [Pseudomonadota bacterium]|nr:FUSC family protein [Pseudomonadota bacterium]